MPGQEALPAGKYSEALHRLQPQWYRRKPSFVVCSFLFLLLFLPFTVIVSSQTCKIYGSIKYRGNGKNPDQKNMLRVGDEESIMGCVVRASCRLGLCGEGRRYRVHRAGHKGGPCVWPAGKQNPGKSPRNQGTKSSAMRDVRQGAWPVFSLTSLNYSELEEPSLLKKISIY